MAVIRLCGLYRLQFGLCCSHSRFFSAMRTNIGSQSGGTISYSIWTNIVWNENSVDLIFNV